MKKTGLLHAELSRTIAAMGHGDALVIGDAGLPVPPGTLCIDLAVCLGVPDLWSVLDTVLGELQVERAVIASEAAQELRTAFEARLPCEQVSHDSLKAASAAALAVVRTGEATPYANIILYSGVTFG
ncbi:D-ribose pyranase [Pseudoruegeria sp. SHC-113]|uniref:D-ribose pyranase n=1 Tax=Pseudoruegeria sp. SHC-113 TaxID=2855439 RepID=UPI0021BB6D94|nr:D-ribose pyranase [Pseudoruegeria sp. SHC-113]MCT8161636.1 D-ribose pyranase [Pseudoruegeria sp. SHC-113]